MKARKIALGRAGRARRGRGGRLVQPRQGDARPAGHAADQPRRPVLEPVAARRGVPRARSAAGAGQVARRAGRRRADAAAARAAAEAARSTSTPTWPASAARPCSSCTTASCAWSATAWASTQRALDHVLGRQVDHLDAGRRGDPRRPHPQHGRQGQRLHPGDERLGLRRRQHPPAADDDLGSELERGLRRPEFRRGAVQQAQARGRRRRAGELHAPAAARGAGRHALALQHRRDQPRRRPARPGDEEAAVDLPVGKDLGAGRHGAAGHLDPQPQRQGDQRLLPPGRDRATSRASASSS